MSLVAEPTEVEEVRLRDVVGRALAATVRAPRAMPLFTHSAMDGFAIDTAALSGRGPWRLPVAGTLFAGTPPVSVERRGGAWRIMTGAALPPGCNAVLAQEQCDHDDRTVRFHETPVPGSNVRRAGSDYGKGAQLMPGRIVLRARHLGLLAANGIDRVGVRRRPRVAVLSTGDELADPGEPLRHGAVFDANRPLLLALVAEAGADAFDLGALPDDAEATRAALIGIAGQFDLVLTSGGVSVGVRDRVRHALTAAGGTTMLWQVAVKPGKPVLLGTLGLASFVGLPGNPLAVFVGFQLFVEPQIRALLDLDPPCEPIVARAAFGRERKPGREEYVPARVVADDGRGQPEVEALGRGSSGTLHALGEADGLAVIASGAGRIDPGDEIGWLPFGRNDP